MYFVKRFAAGAVSVLMLISAVLAGGCSAEREEPHEITSSPESSAVSAPESSAGPPEAESGSESAPESEPEESSVPEESEPEEISVPEESPQEDIVPYIPPDYKQIASGIYDPNAVKYADSLDDPSEAVEVPITYVDYPLAGERYGALYSEKGLNAPVYFGDTNDILRVGSGQYVYSFPPGFGRVIILSAHNISFFGPLKHVEVGDEITFDTNYETYVYRVVSCGVEKADDLEVKLNGMILDEKETLVMYTCYPFEAVYSVPDRFVVYCERVKGLSVKWRK